MKKINFFMLLAMVIATALSSCMKEYDLLEQKSSSAPLSAKITMTGSITAGDSAQVGVIIGASGALSTGSIKSFRIEWGDFSNTGIINISLPSQITGNHAYMAVGAYLMKLTIFSGANATGDSTTASKLIYVVNQLPLNANLSFSGTSATGDSALINSIVTISGANSTGLVKSYLIEYGDGSNTGIQNVTSNSQITTLRAYPSIGSYPVKLTIYDGYNGTGNSSIKIRTLYVVSQIIPPVFSDSLLIKYDSIYQGGGIWLNYWKLNCAKAFGANYSNDCRYRGNSNGWNLTQLPAPVAGWVYFSTIGSERGTIINMSGGTEHWAKLSNNVNVNEHSLTKWNSFGCFNFISKVSGTFPIFDPGSIGDQLINLNKLSNGKIRINIKTSDGTFVVTPGVAPGLKIQYPGGPSVVTMTLDPNDPFGLHYYYDVDPTAFTSGIKFWILQNPANSSTYYYWGGSYWGPNSSDQSYTIPQGTNPPWK